MNDCKSCAENVTPTPRDTDWKSVALRRAEFLLAEAHSPQPTRDQTVTFALRVISNWATIGRDASSSAIKWTNHRVSEAAWKLYEDVSDREWEKGTRNEHQEPISQVWTWILSNKHSISAADILSRAERWPMITITKDEDDSITKDGNRANGSPEVRHKLIKMGRDGPPKKRGRSNISRAPL